ncbi:hypothetical protein LR48_Vigan10g105100 [Vigna angularis]|uniref:Uncharacterized protein n=1 Tax=Phaseolus angularis TaxID=3914 RepID=A0A0L9VK97_PHAAN|nr:hypothetical protein LR48_Vigan10g105100 [Vigna angularis]
MKNPGCCRESRRAPSDLGGAGRDNADRERARRLSVGPRGATFADVAETAYLVLEREGVGIFGIPDTNSLNWSVQRRARSCGNSPSSSLGPPPSSISTIVDTSLLENDIRSYRFYYLNDSVHLPKSQQCPPNFIQTGGHLCKRLQSCARPLLSLQLPPPSCISSVPTCTRTSHLLAEMDKGKSNAFSLMAARRKEELKKYGDGPFARLSHKKSRKSAPEGPLLVCLLNRPFGLLIALSLISPSRRKSSLRGIEHLARNCPARLGDDFKGKLGADTSVQYKDLLIERDNLLAERDDLLAQWVKLAKENTYLGYEVHNEHVAGFKKGITQCFYFFEVPIDHEGYDVMKMVVDRQLVDVPLPTAQEERNEGSSCASYTCSRPPHSYSRGEISSKSDGKCCSLLATSTFIYVRDLPASASKGTRVVATSPRPFSCYRCSLSRCRYRCFLSRCHYCYRRRLLCRRVPWRPLTLLVPNFEYKFLVVFRVKSF